MKALNGQRVSQSRLLATLPSKLASYLTLCLLRPNAELAFLLHLTRFHGLTPPKRRKVKRKSSEADKYKAGHSS